jgi:hypothetical protein
VPLDAKWKKKVDAAGAEVVAPETDAQRRLVCTLGNRHYELVAFNFNKILPELYCVFAVRIAELVLRFRKQ